MRHHLRSTAAVLIACVAGGALVGCAATPEVDPGRTSSHRREPEIVRVVQDPRPVSRPVRLTIPSIAVDERLHGVGLLPDGAMETPDFGDAGWYEPGPRPGAPGPAVLVAHVHGPAGDDVFARLDELDPGDRIRVDRSDGRSTFEVTRVEQVAKDALPHDRIWSDTRRAVLRLITCGGTPDPVTHAYPDNTIVYATLRH